MFWHPDKAKAALLRSGCDEEQAQRLMDGFEGEPGSGPERVEKYFRFIAKDQEDFERLINGS